MEVNQPSITPADYLAKPYHRYVVPESDGTYRGEILEFPGCIATGDTSASALASLEEVADSWLLSMIARNQRIPEPIDSAEFSGKLVLRLPKSLHKKCAHQAVYEGVSLNQFIVSCVAEQLGAHIAGHAMRTMTISSAGGMRIARHDSVYLTAPASVSLHSWMRSPSAIIESERGASV